SQMKDLSSLTATKAILLPSGESAGAPLRPARSRIAPAGCGTVARRTASGLEALFHQPTIPMSAITPKTVARSDASQVLNLRPAVAPGGPWVVPDHFISALRSAALCQRPSGFFARQRRITWSSAGGVIGLFALIGSGSLSKIAEATLSRLLPV